MLRIVSRFGTLGPHSLDLIGADMLPAFSIVTHRGSQFAYADIGAMRVSLTGLRRTVKGRQGHNRHLHVWRWGYYMYKHIGKKRTTLVLDRESWKNKIQLAKRMATKGNRNL